jgi:hypothetical protein
VRTGFLLVLCLPLLAACASVPAGLQADGIYLLEGHEKKLDCPALYKSMWGRMEEMKKLPAKVTKERQAVPPTLFSAFGRWFSGPNRGLSALAEYQRERAHVVALHEQMVSKGCPPVDIDRELAPVAMAMAEASK